MSKILDYIKEYKPTLKEFHSKLIKEGLPIIGLTVPECRKIAKKLADEGDLSVLKEKALFHEHKMIQGFIIGYLKLPFPDIVDLLKEFVLEVDNWAICDCTIATLKIFNENKKAGLDFIEYCFNLNKTYTKRFAYVLLLNYYIEDIYLDYIFDKITNETLREYYVQMAVAWLISYLIIKFPNKTLELFDGRLDRFTNNKAISKIRESFRVNQSLKEMVLKYKM